MRPRSNHTYPEPSLSSLPERAPSSTCRPASPCCFVAGKGTPQLYPIKYCNSENGVKIGKGSGEEDWNQKQEEVERIFCSFQFGLLYKTLAGWTSHLH